MCFSVQHTSPGNTGGGLWERVKSWGGVRALKHRANKYTNYKKKKQSESAHKAGCAGWLPSLNKLNVFRWFLEQPSPHHCPALTVTMASWTWSYMGKASMGGSQALPASRAGRETSSHGNSVQEQEVCVYVCVYVASTVGPAPHETWMGKTGFMTRADVKTY